VQSLTERAFRTSAAFLAAALLFIPAKAFDLITDDSGVYVVVWDPGTITMQLKLPGPTTPLSDGSGSYNASIQTAIQSWNSVIGVVQFSGLISGTTAYRTGNRVNEIALDSKVDGDDFNSGTLAITQSFSDGGNTRVESDIVFNSAFTFDSYRGPRRTGSGAAVDIQRVALHELGHSLGLDHPDEAGQPAGNAVMDSRIGNVDVLQPDDINGGRTLYGAPGVVPANDNFANALTLVVTGNSAQAASTNVAASKQSGEPNHAPNEPGGRSVWWKWTAPAAGNATATTLGSNFDTMLGVYTGTAVNALASLGSNDDQESPAQNPTENRIRTSIVPFNTIAGTTYYFAVDGWEAAFGAVVLNLTFTATGPSLPVITAQPVGATVTTGGSASFSVTATGATGYQWTFNGSNIGGATGATHTISSVTTANAGSYRVVVSNGVGSVNSDTVTLTVNAPPAPPAPPPSSGGGGGGAPSFWFYGALSLLGLARLMFRRR
jgi:Matrixin